MATIHNQTTLVPPKLDLLTRWLPGQPWYRGGAGQTRLAKAGGFRLDDPDGEVGLEFMAVTDLGGEQPVTYHVPLSYRGAPLDGGDDALVGTAEHGVLGPRWVYDGARDPVLVTQLYALLLGEATPQAQSISDTIDPSVTRRLSGNPGRTPAEILQTSEGPGRTDVTVRPTAGPAALTLRVNRVLRAGDLGPPAGSLGHVAAEWSLPDASQARGNFVVLRPLP